MIYAVKLGPIQIEKDGDYFAYIGFADELAMPPILAQRDAEGLRQLAERSPGQELCCEASLAKAGKKLGFASGVLPEWVLEGRGYMALGMGLGPYGSQVDQSGWVPLLAATAKYVEAEPWQWWADCDALVVSVTGSAAKKYEGCLMGAGGEEFGLALYEHKGALARIAAHVDAGDFEAAAKEPALSLTLNFEPAWAAEAVDDAYGTWGLPLPMKLAKGKPARVDATSMAILSAALEAAAKLRPGNLLETAEIPLGKGRIRVTVEAGSPNE